MLLAWYEKLYLGSRCIDNLFPGSYYVHKRKKIDALPELPEADQFG